MCRPCSSIADSVSEGNDSDVPLGARYSIVADEGSRRPWTILSRPFPASVGRLVGRLRTREPEGAPSQPAPSADSQPTSNADLSNPQE